MQSKTIIDLLANEAGVNFIGQHINDDVKKLALEGKKYVGIDIKAASTLISLYQKAKLKLPEHYKAKPALNSKSYEQSTSEVVAKFKAGIMNIVNKRVINITGGIGIDDWAMAEFAAQIDSCDIDAEIHDMAIFNISLFNNLNIKRHLTDGIEFIKHQLRTDIIYADPDRRPNSGRVFRLEDSKPDVLSNMNLLLDKADYVWLKISPMADITYLEKAIPSIKKIYVIAWLGEVKEIFICCSRDESIKKELNAVSIGTLETTCIKKSYIPFKVGYGNKGNYLYEPNRAIIKAGLSAEYATQKNLSMLAPNSHFFISDALINDFSGRTFEIIKVMEYKPRLIKCYLEEQVIKQANITTRQFRETPDNLKKRFGLKDGGDTYLCFTTDKDGLSWFYHCNQIFKDNPLND